MANLKVVINCDEQGQYSVGPDVPHETPEAGAPGGEPQGTALQPVKSLDEALTVARDLFQSNGQGETESPAQEESEFQGGFAKGKGKPAGYAPQAA